ncbi:MAG TPA: MFS transporter [bacterium]|mgnify:CR=1 FL=1|nr:MFS transporter [bacterium]HPP29851.1 MFS transporter [bacterium]
MAELNNREIIKGLYWYCASNAFNTIFCLLTVFGSVFLLFMGELGIPKQLIGAILSLFPFCGIIAPFLSSYIEYIGSKRTYLICFGSRKIIIASLLSLPWIINHYGNRAGLAYLMVTISIFALLRAIGETGFYSWSKEFVPDNLRGRYSALNLTLSNITGFVAIFFASYVIRVTGGKIDSYMLLIGTGCIFGVLSVYFMTFVTGGEPLRNGKKPRIILTQVIEPLRDKNFLYFLAAVGLALFGASMMIFLPLFAREKLGFYPGNVVLLDNATLLGSIIMGFIWGYLGDKFGGRPVVILSLCIYIFVPAGFLLLSRSYPSVFAFSMLLYGISGATLLGRAIGDTRFLYVGILKDVNVIYYTSIFYGWIGFVDGSARITSGYILNVFSDVNIQIGRMTIDSYGMLFLINLFCQISAILIYRKVKPDRQVKTRTFLVMMARRIFNW